MLRGTFLDGASEDGAAWLAFLSSLVARGLSGVKLVTSDSHPGLVDKRRWPGELGAGHTAPALAPHPNYPHPSWCRLIPSFQIFVM